MPDKNVSRSGLCFVVWVEDDSFKLVFREYFYLVRLYLGCEDGHEPIHHVGCRSVEDVLMLGKKGFWVLGFKGRVNTGPNGRRGEVILFFLFSHGAWDISGTGGEQCHLTRTVLAVSVGFVISHLMLMR